MKLFILGKNGNIGKSLISKTYNLYDFVDNEVDADIIALCVSSKIVSEYEFNSNKIYLNFSSKQIPDDNVINGLGCTTLSVLLPLLNIKQYLYLINEPINIVTLLPQNALSKNSKRKHSSLNKSVYTFFHNHQAQLENLLGKEINMSHFITPASNFVTSNIFIKFNRPINLRHNMVNCEVTTRDLKTWNIISTIDNLEEPINYMLMLLNIKIKERENINE